jgi:hypothetical protein
MKIIDCLYKFMNSKIIKANKSNSDIKNNFRKIDQSGVDKEISNENKRDTLAKNKSSH